MNRRADVVEPFREVREGPLLVGHQRAGEHHHDGAPDERPVFGLLDVAVVLERCAFLAQAEVEPEHLAGVHDVGPAGGELLDLPAAAFRERDVADVVDA